jgi:NAD(P)-dependent dehydrogenase (short-subunit alcohol dehydrogenase family)
MKINSDLVLFITGGASGLGAATVRHFHALGAKVAIADLNEENMRLLKNELKDRVITLKCDVTNEEDVKNAMEQTVR